MIGLFFSFPFPKEAWKVVWKLEVILIFMVTLKEIFLTIIIKNGQILGTTVLALYKGNTQNKKMSLIEYLYVKFSPAVQPSLQLWSTWLP